MKNILFRILAVVTFIALQLQGFSTIQNNKSNAETLLSAYFHYNIISEVTKSGNSITTDKNTAQQITETLKNWGKQQKHDIRTDLQNQFADSAKETFSFFIKNYTTAEKNNDLNYLETLTSQLNTSSEITAFTDLRNIVINQWLREDINNAGTLLSEIQTWSDLFRKDSSTPPLNVWLERDKNAPAAVASEPTLATTEPDLPEFVELDDKEENSMDIYDNLQSKRRAQVLEESQKFMKQISEERKATEEEYAQKKAAKATKEAAAVKAHAQKLAAAESEIMEQRKHTWTARVSKLITSVTGGTFSAVTGGVGSAAGAAAAQAIFD
jgi:hypothetical protein